jgi:hypothetical protein
MLVNEKVFCYCFIIVSLSIYVGTGIAVCIFICDKSTIQSLNNFFHIK